MSKGRVSGAKIAEQLGIEINLRDSIPTAGIFIVRTLYPTNDVGVVMGTSNTQSWVDNIGLIRAADIIIQNDMLMHTITSLDD